MPKRATLINKDMPNHQVEVLDWDFNDDPIDGYRKIRNCYGWIGVVKESRLIMEEHEWAVSEAYSRWISDPLRD